VRLFSQDTKVDALRRAPLFEGLGKKELEQLARMTDDLEVPAGKTLCREGETGSEFFVIVGGEVEVTSRDKTLARLGPGDFFGEIALIAQTKRTATVTAVTPLRFFVLTSQAFWGMVDASPGVERTILRALAKRVANLGEAPT
jgi:CRP/FNR family transcriptional regulator, cyclic AMP receptor protein